MPNEQNLIKKTSAKTSGPGMGTVADGAIGSTRVTTPKPKPEVTKIEDVPVDEETVTLYSAGNVFWEGIGRLSRGYNIMTKSKADKWLALDSVRLATPEEVKKEYDQ